MYYKVEWCNWCRSLRLGNIRIGENQSSQVQVFEVAYDVWIQCCKDISAESLHLVVLLGLVDWRERVVNFQIFAYVKEELWSELFSVVSCYPSRWVVPEYRTVHKMSGKFFFWDTLHHGYSFCHFGELMGDTQYVTMASPRGNKLAKYVNTDVGVGCCGGGHFQSPHVLRNLSNLRAQSG